MKKHSGEFYILGVDPGYERLGVALLVRSDGGEELRYSSCIESSSDESFDTRLLSLGNTFSALLAEYAPQLIALETLFLTKNHKTAMAVAEARGVVRYCAARAKIPVFEVGPSALKHAITGDGRADKHAIATMVRRLVTLPSEPRYDDEFDAIALALAASALTRNTYPHSTHAAIVKGQ